MSGLIPKIKVGLAGKKKEKSNLSFDCSTTANFGVVQPTMCREMVPNEKFVVDTASLVRLFSMPKPTFGRVTLRNYHCFVPLVDLWEPFDCMLSGQHFKPHGSTAAFVPTKMPFFRMNVALAAMITSYSDISISSSANISETLEFKLDGATETDVASFLSQLNAAWTVIRDAYYFGTSSGYPNYGLFSLGAGSLEDDACGVIRCGDVYLSASRSTTAFSASDMKYEANNPTVTPESADLITKVGSYTVMFRFKPVLKHLRQVFIGLGYQFSPYNNIEMSPYKLFAFYKAWFSMFRPNREVAWVDTNCYTLIKELSGVNAVEFGHNSTSFAGSLVNVLRDIAKDCYYYLPMDYFSMSVLAPVRSNQDVGFNMSTVGTGAKPMLTSVSNDIETVSQSSSGATVDSGVSSGLRLDQNLQQVSPITLRMFQKLLTFAGKNTIIGRSVRDYLKVHYGITDTDTIEDGDVYRIGSSRVQIEISDVMSTAENEQGYLGEYGGKGIGYGKGEKFDFTADKFGYWLTLTVIVPESGYYQGYMLENRHLDRYHFFMPEFDALGYQVLERGEVMDAYDCDGNAWNPQTEYERTRAFGFVPRFSEYKVGRNIVNGDISLPSLQADMAPYTLDRRFSPGMLDTSFTVASDGTSTEVQRVVRPSFIPSVIYDNFRRIDPTDHLGQYNRIFNVTGNDVDHFVIHQIFNVVAYAPFKSLSEAFDSIGENEPTVERTHS